LVSGCGVEWVVCVLVVRVGVCLRRCWWWFGGVVAGVLGESSACGVCSRLLEMADVRHRIHPMEELRRFMRVHRGSG